MAMNSRVPSLSKVCVSKIVSEIKQFCRGADFDELGNHSTILGPLQYLSSPCVEIIFNYVISTKQLNQSWLAVLIVSHLKTIDLTDCPDIIDTDLFDTLMLRCQHLEKLLIPNCTKIPNTSLCKLLKLNPSLLSLDISNKLTPSIDQLVMKTLVHSCRYLTTLKLSDYQLEDPNGLLVLCGRVAVSSINSSAAIEQRSAVANRENDPLNSDSVTENMEILKNLLVIENSSCADETRQQREGSSYAENEYVTAESNDSKMSASYSMDSPSVNVEWEGEKGSSTKEEEKNKGAKQDNNSEDGHQDTGSGHQVELYGDDLTVTALEVEDHSHEFGCLELETLWLENVNLTDQVAAVLLQNLLHLRDLNVSGTDICNPWRLIDKSHIMHLRHMVDLDVKSTALSKHAMEMIPDFHPALQKLALSSTTLPPQTYRHVAKLSAIAELELIGGQFYPSEPEDIFTNGIMPAIRGVGFGLHNLSLAYFAHVDFAKIILSCPMIRHLDLSRTEIFLTYPCPSVGKCCPNLTSLNLGHAHIEAKDTNGQFFNEEEKVVQQMIGECPVLEELHLCGLTVNDDGVRTMYPGGEYPLRSLNLSWCKKLTIAGIRHLWDKCPLLKDIDVSHCKEVTTADYEAFVENCRETRPIFRLEGTVKWRKY